MKLKLLFALVFCLPVLFPSLKTSGQSFSKPAYYSAMASENAEEINNLLSSVKAAAIAEKDAYEGALMMKKASFLKTAKEKLSTFRSGRSKLENAIAKDKDNLEYRFLRLIIQENAPKALKYKNEISEDSQLLKVHYKTLPSYLQQVIADYSKTSKVLKLS